MGMFSYICKGCGEELIEGEVCRLNGCKGKYDGYGRCGGFSGEDGEAPAAWHEACYQAATPEQKLDERPSRHAPNQGFGPTHLVYMKHYLPGGPIKFSIRIDTWGKGDDFQSQMWFVTAEGLKDQEAWQKARRQAEDDLLGPLMEKLTEDNGRAFDEQWDDAKSPSGQALYFDDLETAKQKAHELAPQFDQYDIIIFGEQGTTSGMVYNFRRGEDYDWKEGKYLGTYTEGKKYEAKL